MRWKKDSLGAEDILLSRARRRERFVRSMSWVASRPAALRARVASVTGSGREKKFCQGEETEAKPERSDITDMPITPMRSREASLRDCEVSVFGVWPTTWRSHWPVHQKPRSHAVKAHSCNIHANLSLPFPLPVNSYPAAEMVEWISSNGIATIRKKRSSEIVTLKAKPRAVGLIVLDISHSINSTSTAANAMVEEKVRADRCLIVGRIWPLLEKGRAYALVLRDRASPERNGNSFCRTRVDTKRKVTMKGREENTIAVEAGIPPGLHSSQSSPAWSMGRCNERGGYSRTLELHEVTSNYSNPVLDDLRCGQSLQPER